MNILVGIDPSYKTPFRVLAKSAVANNPGRELAFFVLHSRLGSDDLAELHAYCSGIGARFEALRIDEALIDGAPRSRRYPVEAFYRLLAPHLLPSNMGRALYLDSDMLVINPLDELWELDLEGNAFAAASHSFAASHATNALNRIRLDTDHDYFNSGVILMDLERARSVCTPDCLKSSLDKLDGALILPDQDVFNAVCGQAVKPLDDELWNYDARSFAQ